MAYIVMAFDQFIRPLMDFRGFRVSALIELRLKLSMIRDAKECGESRSTKDMAT